MPTGTKVTLRLRITGGTAKRVTLRLEIGDPAGTKSSQISIPMTRRRTVWSATYRTPLKPSLVTYTFRATTSRGVAVVSVAPRSGLVLAGTS